MLENSRASSVTFGRYRFQWPIWLGRCIVEPCHIVRGNLKRPSLNPENRASANPAIINFSISDAATRPPVPLCPASAIGNQISSKEDLYSRGEAERSHRGLSFTAAAH